MRYPNQTRRLLRRTLRLQVTKHTQGGKMRVGVVYAAVQDGYLVFPLNVVITYHGATVFIMTLRLTHNFDL